ncbi:MAG: hypothetical protein ACLT98_09015 [Eggerthellaceae bacterium]
MEDELPRGLRCRAQGRSQVGHDRRGGEPRGSRAPSGRIPLQPSRDPEDERRAAAIEATVGHMPTVGELRQDDIDHALSVGAIEKSTYTGYCQHVRRLGDLGEIPVDRVTAQDVQLYIDSLVEDGYCSETVNLMLWTVRETLELASFRMLRPPLDLRRIRAPKHDRPLPRALSAEEKNALLAALPCIHGPLDAIVRLALFAGLRCGRSAPCAGRTSISSAA